MRRMTPTTRPAIWAICAGVLVLPCGEAHGQTTSSSQSAAPVDVDMTPAEKSVEVQRLLKGSRLRPDPGEPAGAIKAHLATEEKVERAIKFIRPGPVQGEPDVDPEPLLNEALSVRQHATSVYPTSRHAWEGLADVLWFKYLWNHGATDLRQAVDAYSKAARLLMQRRGHDVDRDFVHLGAMIAGGLAVLSDGKALDGFFANLRGTEFWPLVRFWYAVALGRLGDPRADPIFREELALMPADETLPAYVDYLWDRGRYGEALQTLDRKSRSRLHLQQHVYRGAILERLGRLSEAEAEYQHYAAEVATASSRPFFLWPFYTVQDRYRIPGSTLQQKIQFVPSVEELPKPQSSIPESPSVAVTPAADRD